MDMFVSSAARAAVPTLTPSPSDISAALMAAAHSLLDPLARGQAVDTTALRAVMTTAFGGSHADGAWDWKSAYDAGEAATVLFLRKFGRGCADVRAPRLHCSLCLRRSRCCFPRTRAAPLRPFIPTAANGPTILGTLMERFALVRIADRAAA
jgi:hypothetical protein